MKRRKLPIGIQTFREIREEEYYYVDKTPFAWRLIDEGKYYFLSRPRRFGKSLFLDTLAEIFAGNEPLFRGLYIHDKWDWGTRYPVVRISFAEGTVRDQEDLDRRIKDILRVNRETLDIKCPDVEDIAGCFAELIRRAAEQYGRRVVVLVDEYDKPILDNLTTPETAREMRDGLRNLYSVIKGQDANIKFAFLTGVSKFSKVSLFSGLNNLYDITLSPAYGTVCGYTDQDVDTVFAPELDGLDREEIRRWYNGYRWLGDPVYNPFDILLFLANDKAYRPYWWSTGNPSFLIDLLREQPRYLPDLENYVADDIVLDSFDVDHIDLVALLWQTGYLTFAEKFTRRERLLYRLRVPNKEIQISLNELFLDYLTGRQEERSARLDAMYDSLADGDPDRLRQAMTALFASISHHNYAQGVIQRYEGYYASVVYACLASLGFQLVAEDTTNKGRVDLAILLPDKVYVIEFKVDQPGRALEQIKARRYHEKYLGQGREVYLVGISFDSEEKNILEFAWEVMSAER